MKKNEKPNELLHPNKIAHYVDATTGKLLFSEPFFDPDNVHEGWPWKLGDPYKSYEEYLKEKNNEQN